MKKLTNRAKMILLRAAVHDFEKAHKAWEDLDKGEANSHMNQVLANTATTRHTLIQLCRELVKDDPNS